MTLRTIIRAAGCGFAGAFMLSTQTLSAQVRHTARPSIGAHAGVYAPEGLRDGWLVGVQGSLPLIRRVQFQASYSVWAFDPRDLATAVFALRTPVHTPTAAGPLIYAGLGAVYDNVGAGRIRGIFDTALVGAEFPGGAVRPFAEARVSRIVWGGAATVHFVAGMSLGPR